MPLTFRSYTQSKGRARDKLGNYIIIAPYPKSSVPNIEKIYRSFKETEHNIKSVSIFFFT